MRVLAQGVRDGFDAVPSSDGLRPPPSPRGRRESRPSSPSGGARSQWPPSPGEREERARQDSFRPVDPRADPALRLARPARRTGWLAHLSSLHRAWRGGDRGRGKSRAGAQRRHGARRTGDPRRRRLIRARPIVALSPTSSAFSKRIVRFDHRDIARHGGGRRAATRP